MEKYEAAITPSEATSIQKRDGFMAMVCPIRRKSLFFQGRRSPSRLYPVLSDYQEVRLFPCEDIMSIYNFCLKKVKFDPTLNLSCLWRGSPEVTVCKD